MVKFKLDVKLIVQKNQLTNIVLSSKANFDYDLF